MLGREPFVRTFNQKMFGPSSTQFPFAFPISREEGISQYKRCSTDFHPLPGSFRSKRETSEVVHRVSQPWVVAQSRRMAQIRGKHFHQLREGIACLENESPSSSYEPLPPVASHTGEIVTKTSTRRPSFLLLTVSNGVTRCPCASWCRMAANSGWRSSGTRTETDRPIISCAL